MDDDLVPDDSFPGKSVTKEEPVPGGDEQSSPEIADNPVQSCDDAVISGLYSHTRSSCGA